MLKYVICSQVKTPRGDCGELPAPACTARQVPTPTPAEHSTTEAKKVLRLSRASIDGKKPWCEQDLLDQGVVSVPGKAGDLVI